LNLDRVALAQVLRNLVTAVNDGRIMLTKVHPADIGFQQAIEGRNNQAICGMPQYRDEKDEPRREACWEESSPRLMSLAAAFSSSNHLGLCGRAEFGHRGRGV